MNLESPGSSAALGFPGWRELRPFAPGPPAPEESAELQMKVDFFRKLGYSSEEVLPVLQKHGVHADTNTVLGELVKHGGAAAGTGEKEKEPAEPPRDAPEAPLLSCGGAAGKRAPLGGPVDEKDAENLRPIVIDGSNVAMSHGDKDVFSCRGILLAVNWFLSRGHSDIMVFVPLWRKEQPRPDIPITDQHILHDLERKKILVFTPSRRVGGRRVVCYDDRFIVKLAFESDGIIVSNDVYRDLQAERPEWKKFIEERLLMYSFVNDKFMPPDDPLGRHGPSLDNFLRKKPLAPEHKKQQCPYGKKCTYGIKCKFYHPERLNQLQRSVADELRANARLSPTRSPSAAKEERGGSRRPLQAESLGPTAPEGEGVPLPKAATEKKSFACKAKPGEKPPHLSVGSTSNKSGTGRGGSGRHPEWYPAQANPLPPHVDSLPFTSQDRLDSGIGSLESQFCEMWSGSSTGLSTLPPEPLATSSSRAQKPHSQRPPAPDSESYGQFQPQGYPQLLPSPISSPHFLAYGPDVASGRVSAHSLPGYSLPGNSRDSRQKFWSEPYLLATPRDVPRGHQLPYESSGKWAAPDRLAEERANVRVRLCGIFHPHLVDAVMSRFPQLLDPQQLAAEILTYKAQNPGV